VGGRQHRGGSHHVGQNNHIGHGRGCSSVILDPDSDSHDAIMWDETGRHVRHLHLGTLRRPRVRQGVLGGFDCSFGQHAVPKSAVSNEYRRGRSRIQLEKLGFFDVALQSAMATASTKSS